ncbi:MAG: 30S ribosomal protein S21 [Planctomycetota bacterium]|nr:30S ribosomal protein S21 [Planctomycetota bacterium]
MRIEKAENLDRALRQFKRLCNDAGIFRELKRNAAYEKPSERRRREDQQRDKNIRAYQRMGRRKPRSFRPKF